MGGLATALCRLTATPDDVLFVGGGGSSAFLKTAQGLELFGNMLEQGNTVYVNGGERSGSRAPLVVRERAVARSRSATSAVTMMTWSYSEICWNKGIYINGGERSGSRVPLVVRERAVARSRFATGTVTMTTRN